MTSRSLAGFGILLALAGTTAAFGGVEAAPRAWLLVAATACLAAASWTATRKDATPAIRAVAVPVTLVVAWGLIQTIPLPRSALAVLAPKTLALYDDTVPEGGGTELPRFVARQSAAAGIQVRPGAAVPQGSRDRGVVGLGRTLSIAPWETRQACVTWLLPTLLFVATALSATNLVVRSQLLWGVTTLGGALGALALLQRLTGRNPFLWSRGIPPDSQPLGPFINPNHFAAFASMAALVGLSLILAHLLPSSRQFSWSAVRSAIVEVEWTLPRVLALSALTSLSIAGLAASRSRGGWLGFVVGLIVMAFRRRRPAWLAGAAAAVALVGVGVGVAAWIGGRNAGTELAPFAMHEQDASGAERLDTWAKCVTLFVDHPVAGTGLGTFRWAFPAYQRLGEWMTWNQAHNDYLQFLCEAGVVGAGVFIFGLYLIARRILLPALSTGQRGPRWTTVGALAAILATSVHSIVDFGLQIPAVATLFAVILGVLAAAATESTEASP